MYTDGHAKDRDFSAKHLKFEGPYENDRNTDSMTLFKDILTEVYGATQSIIGHHLTYTVVENRDGFDYQVVQEVPSADALIFDTECAAKLWGDDWRSVLQRLAIEPVATRDQLLGELYYGRAKRAQ